MILDSVLDSALDSAQWVVAGAIAIAVHLVGIMWLSSTSPAQQAQSPRPGEGIVVSLGTDARTTAENAEALAPRAVRAALAPEPEPARPDKPALAAGALQPAPAATDQVPKLVALRTADTAPPLKPAAAGTASPPESQVVRPRTVETSSPPERPAVGPQSVQAQPAEAVAPQPRTASAQAESDSVPAVLNTVQASQATETRPAEASALTAEAAAAPRVETHVEASVNVPLSSPPEAPVAARSISKPVAEKASASESAAVEVKSIQRAATAAKTVPRAAATETAVESVAALQPRQTRPGVPLQTVTAKPAAAPVEAPAGVKVATAQEPASTVESGTQAEVTEAVKPQTVDLESLLQSGGGSGVMARYAGVLKGWLQKNMHYPRAARLAGQEGRVVIRFVIDRNGKVRSIKLESSSGFPLLDQEAKEMVERGDPFPAMPEEMPGQRLEIRVPVSFHVRNEAAIKVIPPINLK